MNKGGTMASREYLEEALKLAKNKLPGWAWAKIHQAARGAAGGKINHVEGSTRGDWESGETVRQIAMSRTSKGSLSDMSDGELKSLWKSFGGWFKTYKRLNRSVDTLTSSSIRLIQEMEKRGIEPDGSPLLKAVKALVTRKTRTHDIEKAKAVLGAFGEVQKSGIGGFRFGSPLIFVVSRPNEVEKARGEYLAGPDGRTFREVYLDPLGVAKSACSVLDASQIGLLDWLGDGFVVALGKDAKRSLGSRADLSLPHPNATRRFGDSGEVARKLKKVLSSPRFATLVAQAETLPIFKEGDEGFFTSDGKGALNLVGYDVETCQPKLASLSLSGGVDLVGKSKGDHKVHSVSEDLIEIGLDRENRIERYLLKRDVPGVFSSTWTIEGSVGYCKTAEATIENIPRSESDEVDSQADDPRGACTKSVDETSREVAIVMKADSDKQIVYGIVLDPYQIDAHDDWISPKAIEETAHQWMEKSRVIGFNHQKKADATAIESWLVPYPSPADYKKAMANEDHNAYTIPLGDDVAHSGSWVLGAKLSDADWAKVLKGELNAYSIGGFGARNETSLKDLPKVTFIDLSKG